MTYAEFVATAAPVSDAIWAILQQEDVTDGHPREAFTMYAGEYVLHTDGASWFPHAWWYRPVAKCHREDAEAVLWEWRKEWI